MYLDKIAKSRQKYILTALATIYAIYSKVDGSAIIYSIPVYLLFFARSDNMDRVTHNQFSRFHHDFTQCWMRVDSQC